MATRSSPGRRGQAKAAALLLAVPTRRCHRTSPPRLPFQYSAPTQSQHSDSMLLLASFGLRPTRPSFVRARGPHPPALPRPTLSSSAAIKELTENPNSWRVPQRCWPRPCSCFWIRRRTRKEPSRGLRLTWRNGGLPAELLLTRFPTRGGRDGADWRKKHDSQRNRIGHHDPDSQPVLKSRGQKLATREPAASLAARRRHNPVRAQIYHHLFRSDRNHARRTRAHSQTCRCAFAQRILDRRDRMPSLIVAHRLVCICVRVLQKLDDIGLDATLSAPSRRRCLPEASRPKWLPTM